MANRALPLIVSATLLATGCSSRAEVPPNVVVADSGGITILQNNTPEWSATAAWELEEKPILDIGGDSTQELFRVGALQGGPSGVAVLNGGSSEILGFDWQGRLDWRVGGRGEGPKAFARLTDLYRCAGDTLVANDFTRVMIIDPAGRFVRSEPVLSRPGGGAVRIRGVGTSCGVVLVSSTRRVHRARGEIGRDTIMFYWDDLSDGTHELIGTFRTHEVVATPVGGVLQPLAVPWGARGAWTVGGGRFHYGTSEKAEVQVFDPEKGLQQIIRWKEPGRAVTSKDRDLYTQKRAWLLGLFPSLGEAVPPLDETVVAARTPIFESLLADDSGQLWVRRYAAFLAGRPDLYDLDLPLRYTPPPGTDPESWLVFAESGRWLGEVKTPPDLSVRTIAHGIVLGVWRDSLDVEHVRAYRIKKPGEMGGQ